MGGRDNTPTGDDCKTRCCGRNCARRPMVHHRGLAWMGMIFAWMLGLRFDRAWLFVHRDVVVCCRAFRRKVRQRRVLGPVGTGPRLEPWSLYKDLGSFPLHRLFGSKWATPERGQMLRRAGVRPLASLSSRGPRRQTAGMGDGATTGVAVRSSPPSFDSPSRAPLGL